MGGIISRNVKTRIIRQWLSGLTRQKIAKNNDIGDGTVTGIINEARRQKEYNDIDLLREVALRLKEEELELSPVGFAIRLERIMEENDIKEDQIESIIQDIATCCLKHKIPYDTLIHAGREALFLEQKYSVPIEKIPEYITQGKEIIDRLEDQRQEILVKKELAREERDTIVDELEKYGKDIPLIKRIMGTENKLCEARRSETTWKTRCAKHARDVEMLDNLNIEQSKWLSEAYKELERIKEDNEKLTTKNRGLKQKISDLKTF
jgi:chromosome segregation ATPase